VGRKRGIENLKLGRLLCSVGNLLGIDRLHKWEYIFRSEAVSRGCLRCGKSEVQIYELARKYSGGYWHPAAEGWTWPELKRVLIEGIQSLKVKKR